MSEITLEEVRERMELKGDIISDIQGITFMLWKELRIRPTEEFAQKVRKELPDIIEDKGVETEYLYFELIQEAIRKVHKADSVKNSSSNQEICNPCSERIVYFFSYFKFK